MDLICFVIAIIIFGAACHNAIKVKYDFSKCTRWILIGVLGAVVVLIYPVYHGVYDTVGDVLQAFLYALKTLAGRQNVDLIYSDVIRVGLIIPYKAIFYILFFSAPILTTNVIVSAFGNVADKIHYGISFARKICVFSQLNENALTLAESLKRENAFSLYVFCNYKKDEKLKIRARKIGAVLLEDSEVSLSLKNFVKEAFFYEINQNHNINIQSGAELIKKYRNESKKNIQVTVFSSGIVSELVLDSIDNGRVVVREVDETSIACQSLLYGYPLFKNIIDNKISVLIVGAGDTGLECARLALCCGQMDGIDLEINICDKSAKSIERKFYAQSPGLRSEEYNIRFIELDAMAFDLEDALKQYCNNATYIIVSMKDDELNLDTGIRMRQFFLRNDKKNYAYEPPIFLRIRNPVMERIIEGTEDGKYNTRLREYGFRTFGSINKVYSVENLFNSPIERLGLNIHYAYKRVLGDEETSAKKIAARKDFYEKIYNQKASIASALHIKYKMYAAGINEVAQEDIDDSVIDRFEELIKDNEVAVKLAELEHRRWNAFQRCRGFVPAQRQEVSSYLMHENANHVHTLARMHPALVEWDELDGVSKMINEVKSEQLERLIKKYAGRESRLDRKIIDKLKKDVDMKKNDAVIIEYLPDIIRKA